MKPLTRSLFLRDLPGALASLILLPGTAHAAPFVYSPGDLILAFRVSGNASDLVVNLGSVTNYNALATGTSIPLTRLDATQLASVFPNLDGLSWSVAGASRPPGVDGVPLQSLWVTGPRLDPAVQSPSWLRKGQFLQGNAASQIDVIGLNAAAYSNSQPAGPNNTAAGVAVPSSGDYALSPILGTEGDLSGNFQGSVEATTAADFASTPGAVSRADLYELLPGTSAAGTLDQPGRLLGTFELKPDGSLTFTTGQPTSPATTILTVTRRGDVTAISFASVAGAHYRLRRTDAAGLTLPTANWIAGASADGTGSVLTLEDTSTTEAQFYRVEAQP